MPRICTLVLISTVPSKLPSADGSLRTLSWEMVCPSAGATNTVGVAGSGVGDGRGVCVGGNVAVMMIGRVAVGVFEIVTSALQAALNNSMRMEVKSNTGCDGDRFTTLLYPRIVL